MKLRLLLGGLITLTILLCSSCSKEKFRLFDDIDCVFTEDFVRIELPLTDLASGGGIIKLDANVYIERASYKMSEEIGREFLPLPFTAELVNAPSDYQLKVVDGKIIVTAPANLTDKTVTLEVAVKAKGVTKYFTLTQNPKKYDVGGTIV